MMDKLECVKAYQKRKIKKGICLYGGCWNKAAKNRQHCNFHIKKKKILNKKYYLSKKSILISLPFGCKLIFINRRKKI